MNCETSRLSIRPYEIQDYDSWIAGFTARNPRLNRHDCGPIEADQYLQSWFGKLIEKHRSLAEKDDTYHFGIFQKDGGKHLGHIDIHIIKREIYSWAWIGYYIHNQYQGRGYGSEAVSASIRSIGFDQLGLKRIEAIINTDNAVSIRLAEKCGLSLECTKEKFIFEFGEWTDNHVYVILNDHKADK